MPVPAKDANNYHAIAAQLRAIAAIEHDPQRAEIIRKIADDYDIMGTAPPAAPNGGGAIPDADG